MVHVYNDGDIDFEGCVSCLNPESDQGKFCVVCNRHERRSRKTICKKCPFCFNSSPKKGEGSRVGCGAVFSKCGLVDAGNIGKSQFFYFLYYQMLSFNLPDLPVVDYLGNFNSNKLPINCDVDPEKVKNFTWILHHINSYYWDDRVWNLLLVVNTEHGYIHGLDNREYQPWKLIQERTRTAYWGLGNRDIVSELEEISKYRSKYRRYHSVSKKI